MSQRWAFSAHRAANNRPFAPWSKKQGQNALVSGAECEHDFSNVLLRHESDLRVGDLFERESFGHDRGYAPALDVFDQIGRTPRAPRPCSRTGSDPSDRGIGCLARRKARRSRPPLRSVLPGEARRGIPAIAVPRPDQPRHRCCPAQAFRQRCPLVRASARRRGGVKLPTSRGWSQR